jgi:hypothetical protein
MKNNKNNINEKLLILIGFFIFMFSNTFALQVEVLNTDPSPIVAGEYADITIRFYNEITNNNDNDLNNFYVKIEKTDFILPIYPSIFELSKIKEGESITRTFRVYFSEDLKQGNINLPIIIGYNGLEIKKDLSIFILDSLTKPDLYIGKIKTIPDELLEDSKNNKLIITLQNLGDKSADLLKANLVVDDTKINPSYSYSMEDSISSIEANSEKDLEFVIDIKKNVSDKVLAKLILRYRTNIGVDSNNYKTYIKEINFSIPISPSPFLVVDSIEPLTDMKIGTTDQKIKVRIKNIGQEDADDAIIRVVPDISYPFIFEKTTQYIGSKIKVGEYADVIYTFEITKDAEIRNYSSKVVLDSLVGESRYSQEDIINIQTIKSDNKISYSTVAKLIVFLILLISLIIGLNTYKKNKK